MQPASHRDRGRTPGTPDASDYSADPPIVGQAVIRCIEAQQLINVTHVDLNLLVALDLLLEEGSVGAAADRLGLSQPAMSRTLARIRRTVGDEVLVRSGRVMLPTPYAESIRREVHDLVQRSEMVLTGAPELDLSRLEQTFAIRCHDALANLVAPDLIRVARQTAPGVRLRFPAETIGDAHGLRTAETDLEIGAVAAETNDTHVQHIGSSPMVLMSAEQDRLPRAIPIEQYCALTHVLVSRKGRLTDVIDDALSSQGRTRKVLASVPSTRLAIGLVRAGGVVTTVPELVTRYETDLTSLVVHRLPVPTPQIQIAMRWHRRHDQDPAQVWLRSTVNEALQRRLNPPADRAAAFPDPPAPVTSGRTTDAPPLRRTPLGDCTA